jgi:hypothetical protein
MLGGLRASEGGFELLREADFWGLCCGFNSGSRNVVFAGVFCDFVVKLDGNLWSFCGALCGECGLLAVTFLARKNAPRF